MVFRICEFYAPRNRTGWYSSFWHFVLRAVLRRCIVAYILSFTHSYVVADQTTVSLLVDVNLPIFCSLGGKNILFYDQKRLISALQLCLWRKVHPVNSTELLSSSWSRLLLLFHCVYLWLTSFYCFLNGNMFSRFCVNDGMLLEVLPLWFVVLSARPPAVQLNSLV